MSDLHPPLICVREVVQRALEEDFVPLGDITSSLLPPGATAKAEIIARAEGVLAGRTSAEETFRQVDRSIRAEWLADDGTELAVDDVIVRLEGPVASILAAERTALNFLAHLSGIASLTRRFVRAGQNKARIRDTRKTTPGLRALEKAAVRAGGGVNHRGSLSDGILIKDNHLVSMSISDAVRRAHLRWPGRHIEVECDTFDQMQEALAAGVDLIMLDNMSPEEVERCVKDIDGRCPVEVSGRIAIQNVSAYVAVGVDLISVGSLTHSAPVLDMSLDLVPVL